MKQILILSGCIVLAGMLIFFSCTKEYSCENCPHTNQPPVAKAGPDQRIILPIDTVSVDGSASTNPDGIIISYLWTKISGPSSIIIQNVSSVKTAVENLVVGIYQIELKITDNGGLSARDTMRIIVDSAANISHPPVANINADTTIVLPNDSTFLNGDISYDPDGVIVSYKWVKISGPSSFNIVNPQSVQTKVYQLVQGTYEFELTVTDNSGLSSKDTTKVMVKTASAINLPPVANAGQDISLNYDFQTCSVTPSSISLNGSASSDPDGTIVDYSWSMLPGSPIATIANPSAMNTTAANFTLDTYFFVLTVTDDKQAMDEDTVMVKVVSLMNRPIVPAQLVPIGNLSQSRENIAIASVGNKVLFAGGFLSLAGAPEKSRVDIYDIINNAWSTAELSQARYNIGVAVYQNKIYFAGGNCSNSAFLEIPSNRVDIYDASANIWSIDSISVARPPIGVSVSDKIVFAGGGQWDVGPASINADIFNPASGLWSLGTLSFGRRVLSATSIGTKAFFAGGDYGFDGLTGNVEVYDATSDSWSVSTFSTPFHLGWAPSGIAIGNKNYWAGGVYFSQASHTTSYTNHVEIRDENTNTSTFECLFQPNSGFGIVEKNNKIVFFTGTGVEKNKFDIYDITTGTWSIGELSQKIQGASIISVNNTIYVAGGYVNGVLSNKVWRLDF